MLNESIQQKKRSPHYPAVLPLRSGRRNILYHSSVGSCDDGGREWCMRVQSLPDLFHSPSGVLRPLSLDWTEPEEKVPAPTCQWLWMSRNTKFSKFQRVAAILYNTVWIYTIFNALFLFWISYILNKTNSTGFLSLCIFKLHVTHQFVCSNWSAVSELRGGQSVCFCDKLALFHKFFKGLGAPQCWST